MFSKSLGMLCIVSVALCCFLLSSSASEVAKKAEAAAPQDSVRIALQTSAFSILKRSCAVSGCHTGKHPEQNLSLDPAVALDWTKNVPSRENKKLMRIDTVSPEKSYLLMKIRGDSGIKGKRMPRGGAPLSNEDIKTMELWIQSLSVAQNADTSANPKAKGTQAE